MSEAQKVIGKSGVESESKVRLLKVSRDVAVGCRDPNRDRVMAPGLSVVQTRPGGNLDD